MKVRFLTNYKTHNRGEEVAMEKSEGVQLASLGIVHIIERDPPRAGVSTSRIAKGNDADPADDAQAAEEAAAASSGRKKNKRVEQE